MTDMTREEVEALRQDVLRLNWAGWVSANSDREEILLQLCTLALQALDARGGWWSDINEHGRSKQQHAVAKDIIDYFGPEGFPDRVHVYRSVYGGLSVSIEDESGGHRISGQNIGGGQHLQESPLDPADLLCALFSNAQLQQIVRGLPTPPTQAKEYNDEN